MIPAEVFRFDTPTARLRAIAFVEGCSYLVLLCVAMPLKYAAGMPAAVRVVGSLHGFLFVWLALLTLGEMLSRGRSFGWGLRIGIASLIPFGTFLLDRDLASDDEVFRAQVGSEGAVGAEGAGGGDGSSDAGRSGKNPH